MGFPWKEIQLTAQVSHLELSKMLELQMVKGSHGSRNKRG